MNRHTLQIVSTDQFCRLQRYVCNPDNRRCSSLHPHHPHHQPSTTYQPLCHSSRVTKHSSQRARLVVYITPLARWHDSTSAPDTTSELSASSPRTTITIDISPRLNLRLSPPISTSSYGGGSLCSYCQIMRMRQRKQHIFAMARSIRRLGFLNDRCPSSSMEVTATMGLWTRTAVCHCMELNTAGRLWVCGPTAWAADPLGIYDDVDCSRECEG